ncbi:hypothetical protein PLESTF_001863500 [Pleodorina starrii]|nr:hypothetical protein PLESTF_001863500 [Pleodorina starrii]
MGVQQQANLQHQPAGLAAQAGNGNNPPANPAGPGVVIPAQQPPAQAAIQPQLLQLPQHQNHAAVVANISFGRDEALRQRFTELGGQFNATCPASVKFVAGFARDVGSNIYAAWHAAKFLLPSMAELGPVVDAMFKGPAPPSTATKTAPMHYAQARHVSGIKAPTCHAEYRVQGSIRWGHHSTLSPN